MYMCGRLRTASRPSSTLMLSAEYSPGTGAELPLPPCSGGRLSCAVSNVHLGTRARQERRAESARKDRVEYHAKFARVKANRDAQVLKITPKSGRRHVRDPTFRNLVENRLCGRPRDELRVGRREDHLASERPQVRHEERVPVRVELARDVIEEEERSAPLHAPQALDLRDLESQDRRARLPLAREGTCRLIAERDGDIVRVRAHARVAAFPVARKPPGESSEKARFEFAFAPQRCFRAEPVRIASRRLIRERQGGVLAGHLGERPRRPPAQRVEEALAPEPDARPEPC